MNSKKLSRLEIDAEFEKVSFSIGAELFEKGYHHPDGSVKTLGNAHEKRFPKEEPN